MTEEVRYPALRGDVIDALEALADPEYQARVWLDGEFPGDGNYESLDMAVHALYDDAQLDGGAERAIGTVLRDEHEAQALDGVIEAMEAVFTELGGTELPDREIVGALSWPRVVDTAKLALDRMRREAT